jgi:hypothetical protein
MMFILSRVGTPRKSSEHAGRNMQHQCPVASRREQKGSLMASTALHKRNDRLGICTFIQDAVRARNHFLRQGTTDLKEREMNNGVSAEPIMPTDDQVTKFILALDEVEHAELLTLLEQALRETHVEARRTESPDYQEEVHHHESVLQGVLQKLRRT